VSHISQYLKTEIESRELGGYYQERICIWPISKDLRGELGVADQERQQCSKSDCLTLKGQVRLKAQVHHHAPGDSIMSRPLEGELGGEIVFACVDDGELRGYHIGRVEWRAGGSTLIGQLSGAPTPARTVDRCLTGSRTTLAATSRVGWMRSWRTASTRDAASWLPMRSISTPAHRYGARPSRARSTASCSATAEPDQREDHT